VRVQSAGKHLPNVGQLLAFPTVVTVEVDQPHLLAPLFLVEEHVRASIRQEKDSHVLFGVQGRRRLVFAELIVKAIVEPWVVMATPTR